MRALLLIGLSASLLSVAGPAAVRQDFTGRWNFTGTGEHADRVYWLEIVDEDGALAGRFLNRTGSPLPLRVAEIKDGELQFRTSGAPGRLGALQRVRRDGDRLVGTFNDRGTEVAVIGMRPPVWPEADANARHRFGAPVALFDGSTLDAFDLQHASRPSGWSIEDGAMTNTPRANNLVSKERFMNFRLQAEYKLEPGSNSGLYLRGRYELQVFDDYGKPPEKTGHMAIYGWTPPLVNASRPAGEWQTADIVLVGNRVTATLNGRRVHDNAAIQAITGGALDVDETSPGPIMIQGDHNKVSYRRVVVTPIK